jgi:hypothetical protein
MTDYQAMSDAELRSFVLLNPQNQEAFYAYVDRINKANSNRQPKSPEEALAEIEQLVKFQSSAP